MRMRGDKRRACTNLKKHRNSSSNPLASTASLLKANERELLRMGMGGTYRAELLRP
jgi:hypothetical protein